MAMFGVRFIAWVFLCVVLFAACLLVGEIEVVRFPDSLSKNALGKKLRYSMDRGDYGPDVVISPHVLLPNEGRPKVAATALGNDVGTRSVYNGVHQEERRLWLRKRAEQLRIGENAEDEREEGDRKSWEEEEEKGVGGALGQAAFSNDSTQGGLRKEADDIRHWRGGESERDGEGEKEEWLDGALPLGERLSRLEKGEKLWRATYVPPIAPERKRELITKWTTPNEGEASGYRGGAPRILFVLSSFDRGRRLGARFSEAVDKLDYVLMIVDEVREACEAGFRPELHLIAAWDPEPQETAFRDRLFCNRTGESVPYTFERHNPNIMEVLSVKHRIYMKPRVEAHDVFIQMEDDMILTLNHILLFLEESWTLALRKDSAGKVPKFPAFDLIPGFIRVEPGKPPQSASDLDPKASGVGGEWFEWEIALSRFRGAKVVGAGTYLTLDSSRVLPYSGNNQGMWMATQGQLKRLQHKCGYLRYDERSNIKFVEMMSGSLEMFSPLCRVTKVFPAARFEDFLVHHRTNNKNGIRGESIPAVSVSILRLWASQVVRDSGMLREIGETPLQNQNL